MFLYPAAVKINTNVVESPPLHLSFLRTAIIGAKPMSVLIGWANAVNKQILNQMKSPRKGGPSQRLPRLHVCYYFTYVRN